MNQKTVPETGRSSLNLSFYLLVSAYLLILAGRLYLTTRPPINSTDLLRYLGFGREFWTYGLTIYDYTPRQFGDTPYSNIWADIQFIYPAIAMFFFAAISGIWPSLFFARLVLSLLELVNAGLVTRLTGDRWYGLLYFLNPVSLWWISHEGQYEPLVAFLTLLALLYLARRSPWSYGWLGLAIQAKYWPGVLLPYFLWQDRRPRSLVFLAVSFIPSLLFVLFSVYIFHIIGSDTMAQNCNPFLWNVMDDTKSCWTPMWHLLVYAGATYGILLVGLAGLVRDWHRPQQRWAYLGLLLFVLYYKSINWAAAWYLVMFGVFGVPIESRWVRWTILLLSMAEPIAWAGLLGSPIGWINPEPPWPYIWGGLD